MHFLKIGFVGIDRWFVMFYACCQSDEFRPAIKEIWIAFHDFTFLACGPCVVENAVFGFVEPRNSLERGHHVIGDIIDGLHCLGDLDISAFIIRGDRLSEDF